MLELAKLTQDSEFDAVALGEVMLRLDPGDVRIHTARSFRVWEGGGEYNVARGLRRCFGLRTCVVTSLVDNAVGRLVEDFILQGGVDTSQIVWRPDDGCGRDARNGLNFTERGHGVRAAVGVSDRGHTAASQLTPDDVDWDDLFGRRGVRWLHTGGIFAGLSKETPAVLERCMAKAKEHGTIVSYDLNYRESLWKSLGGPERAQEINRRLAPYVDVMLGNEEDFVASLGFEIPGFRLDQPHTAAEGFRSMILNVSEAYPDLSVVATTLRGVRSASSNDWGAIAWSRNEGFVESAHRDALEIYDRVGGGDSFASGLIYGLLTGFPLQKAVDYGAAHGALAMTTPGDTSMATLKDVARLAEGGLARISR